MTLDRILFRIDSFTMEFLPHALRTFICPDGLHVATIRIKKEQVKSIVDHDILLISL